MKCSNCNTEYEGNFCPNCGQKADTNSNSSNNQDSSIYVDGMHYNNPNPNQALQKTKKPLYKKWWFWLIIVLVVIIIASFGSSSDSENETQTNDSSITQQEENTKATEIVTEKETQETTEKVTEQTKPAVPSEYKNALIKAESYAKNMHMSKAAIYDQLISEYGERFSKDAAKYAMDNIDGIDWKKNALAKAKSYQDNMHMSKDAIYDQLISEYGEKFTKAEAKYAIDNLD